MILACRNASIPTSSKLIETYIPASVKKYRIVLRSQFQRSHQTFNPLSPSSSLSAGQTHRTKIKRTRKKWLVQRRDIPSWTRDSSRWPRQKRRTRVERRLLFGAKKEEACQEGRKEGILEGGFTARSQVVAGYGRTISTWPIPPFVFFSFLRRPYTPPHPLSTLRWVSCRTKAEAKPEPNETKHGSLLFAPPPASLAYKLVRIHVQADTCTRNHTYTFDCHSFSRPLSIARDYSYSGAPSTTFLSLSLFHPLLFPTPPNTLSLQPSNQRRGKSGSVSF